MRIFIDADVLVYRIGFGCAGWSILETLDAMETMVKNIKDKFPNHEPILALSRGGKTFRHQVAVTLPYKGNRKKEKPEFYNELRNYLIEEMGAILSPDGFEADDLIGCNVDKKKDIIASNDKDFFMVPAKAHYNFVKDEIIKIKRPTYYFWKQMCTGDVADNIRGLKGIGVKKAELMLDGVKTKQMRSIVEEAYQREFGDSWADRFMENGKLLWIKRHYDKEFYHYV